MITADSPRRAPILFPFAGARIWVAGHRGMVGAALVRRLATEDCTVLTAERRHLDLTRQAEVEQWLEHERPDAVILAAARVGGIHANDSRPADFLSDNLAIARNVIDASASQCVRKLLFLGSSCVYPRAARQPMTEDGLMTGPLEPTSQWYAVAKIAGLMLCQAHRRQHGHNFISVTPTNLYGPGDSYHPTDSHAPAALLRRLHEAKVSGAETVTVWGTGRPLREFLFVDDLADACVFLLQRYAGERTINVGTGVEVSIGAFARALAEVIGYDGRLVFDTTRPDGSPRKLLDSTRLRALGWRPRVSLREGLERTYADFLAGGGRHRDAS
ncbi:GDP-L-fucose synthase family protein [Roseospira visakhapatnamensis]|uniref:GDP-L-fucose synthase n=1 Tax=Roseospira visakhapatnamensis TaxID=390880 RepID=A0A7W6REZ5_9PROT|nr:GDP-L-fucose synthase [Roseospira visakhapatnamensis]MBB4266804.1 GDP-L-fucose synthase [Roseospira visakhapatnamensis]